jgi:hypothetical protein
MFVRLRGTAISWMTDETNRYELVCLLHERIPAVGGGSVKLPPVLIEVSFSFRLLHGRHVHHIRGAKEQSSMYLTVPRFSPGQQDGY